MSIKYKFSTKNIDNCLVKSCLGKVTDPDEIRSGHCQCEKCGQVYFVLGQQGATGHFSGLGYCGDPQGHFVRREMR